MGFKASIRLCKRLRLQYFRTFCRGSRRLSTFSTSSLKPTTNKTRTSKVGAISNAQKAQNIFLGKNLKFLKIFFFQKMSQSVKKCKRGELFGFNYIHSVAKFQKTRRGHRLGTLKNFRNKVAQCRKKPKGRPFRHVRFCRFP